MLGPVRQISMGCFADTNLLPMLHTSDTTIDWYSISTGEYRYIEVEIPYQISANDKNIMDADQIYNLKKNMPHYYRLL